MLEEQIKQVCLELGYEPREFLRSTGHSPGLSVLAGSAQHGEVVIRFNASGAGSAAASSPIGAHLWNTRPYATKPPYAPYATYSTYATGAQSAGGPGNPGADSDEKLLQEITLRWSMGVMAGGAYVNPVIEYGHRKIYIYQVRPWYPLTLFHLIERQVSPDHNVLFRIVEQIWAALAFLHQFAVNQPHGGIAIHNVGFASKDITDARVSLLDLQDTLETRRAELKRKDFQDLGMLIYQLAGSLDRPVDAVDAAMRCPNASWKKLGNRENAWKSLTKRLLEVDSFPFGYDLAGAREQLLGPLLPPKSAYTLVARPRPPEAQPPYKVDRIEREEREEREPEVVAPIDYQGEIARLIGAHDYLDALRLVLGLPDDFEPREQLPAWGDLLADHAGDELGNNTEFLHGMEILAGIGSQRACLRLGTSLAKTNPGEALGWLVKAAEAGMAESYYYLAGIFEQGGDGVTEDCARALNFYQASLDLYDSSDWNVHYRMAAMILREKTLSDKLPMAIQLLEAAHANRHYRSTDLLAQCHAQGLGVEADEKKAFQLFADSWDQSKRADQNYHTASNNLGVCFAIGFGTRKDPSMARHYFKQGELAGHEASKKNLQALLQST